MIEPYNSLGSTAHEPRDTQRSTGICARCGNGVGNHRLVGHEFVEQS